MACFSPLSAWQAESGGVLFFSERPDSRALTIPCGQCIGCRLERSRHWAIRCMHEASMHAFSEFVTLTYNDDSVPVDHSLHYVDFQLFMKRLRKYFRSERQRINRTHGEVISSRIRFYMCGEYGEETRRPHFHACIFGCYFPDRQFFRRSGSGEDIYTSEILSDLWKNGHCSTGNVTFESAAYVARYILKKRFGDVANEHSHYRYVDDYGEVHYREPELSRMSLKPGIGGDWFEKFASDVYPRDRVVLRGLEVKPPKYYDRLLERRDILMREFLELTRSQKADRFVDETTPDRLRVREICTRARLSSKVRGL